MGMVMRELRQKYGASAVAELCLLALGYTPPGVAGPAIGFDGDVVVIDGIRSMAEIEIFRRAGHVKLIAIAASPGRRFGLLTRRGRSDDPSDVERFNIRDERELSIGIGNAIALADEVVSNEHLSLDELGAAALKIVSVWMKERPDGER
jgi:dephospho-CoA kinase